MKLIILKNNLAEALFSVERSISTSGNLPILKNILISAEGERIIITATNLEMAVSHTCPGKISQQGRVTVPLGVFSSIIKNLNSERITLETKEENLFIVTDNYEATLQGADPKEFPIIPEINTKNSFSIEAVDFLNSVKSVIIATQFSDIRPEISGVYIRYKEGKLVFVATDSFRLAEKTFQSASISSNFDDVLFILPLHTAEELLRVINDSDGQINIFIDQNQILFSTKTKNIISRLIDGRFPDYEPIIPKETETEIIINRSELLSAIKLTSSFSGRTNDVYFEISENKKVMEIQSSEGSLGKNTYKIPIKLKGPSISVTFNWKYISDGLKTHSSEDVVFGFNSSEKPAAIRNPKDPSLVYVVVPIRR